MRFCWASPGRFRMGSPASEPGRRADEAQVDVTFSRGFWIGKYEVTQGQWKAVAGAFPRDMDKGAGADVPVYWVSFLNCEEFCRKMTGSVPNWEIRLPTEAEWEYACRAGTVTATSFGDRFDTRRVNFNGKPYNGGEPGTSLGRSTPVGSYPANAWGLHDMHGNVWEWCRDWYHDSLPGGTSPDLTSVKGVVNRDGTYSRVRRGGAWTEDGWACRSAMRLRYEPERNSDHIGFRVVAVERPSL